MGYKYEIYHYVVNTEGQYVSQTIWSGNSFIRFAVTLLKAKRSGKYKHLAVNATI